MGAIHLLEKKDAHDVLDGLGKLGSALELLPTAVQKCDDAAKEVKDEAPKLLKALETLKHPVEFAYHVGKDLIVNHADIFQEVSAAIDDYHAQKWEDAGRALVQRFRSSSLVRCPCSSLLQISSGRLCSRASWRVSGSRRTSTT